MSFTNNNRFPRYHWCTYNYNITIIIIVDVSNMSRRAGMLMSARVHPGESNSSWMMQGLIDWLTSDAPHAKVDISMLSLVIK